MSNATKKDNSYYFPSRFDIGEEVLFDGRNGQTKIKAKVIAVKFTESKVYYDVELFIRDGYYQNPICNVDSIFITPINDS